MKRIFLAVTTMLATIIATTIAIGLPAAQAVTTPSGLITVDGTIIDLAVGPNNTALYAIGTDADGNGKAWKIDADTRQVVTTYDLAGTHSDKVLPAVIKISGNAAYITGNESPYGSVDGRIYRIDLATDQVSTLLAYIDGLHSLAIDMTNQRLYFTDRSGADETFVYWCSLSNCSGGQSVFQPWSNRANSASIIESNGMVLSPAGTQMYLVDRNVTTGVDQLRIAFFDGSPVQTVLLPSNSSGGHYSLAADSDHVYVTYGNSVSGESRLYTVPLSTKVVSDPITLSGPPMAIAQAGSVAFTANSTTWNDSRTVLENFSSSDQIALGDTPSITTSFSLSGLGLQHASRIAVNSDASTAYVSGDDGKIAVISDGAAAPAIASVSSTSSASARLNWLPDKDHGQSAITGYNVQVSTSENSGFTDATGTCAPSTTTTSTATSCEVTGLQSGMTYYYRVSTITGVSDSEYSIPLSAVAGGPTRYGGSIADIAPRSNGTEYAVGSLSTGTGAIWVIDQATLRVTDVFAIPGSAGGNVAPATVVINGSTAYVGGEENGIGRVFSVDLDTGQFTTFLQLGSPISQIVFANGKLYYAYPDGAALNVCVVATSCTTGNGSALNLSYGNYHFPGYSSITLPSADGTKLFSVGFGNGGHGFVTSIVSITLGGSNTYNSVDLPTVDAASDTAANANVRSAVMSADGSTIYVTYGNPLTGLAELYSVNTSTMAVSGPLSLPQIPTDIAVTPTSNRGFIANAQTWDTSHTSLTSSSSVTQLDLTGPTPIKTTSLNYAGLTNASRVAAVSATRAMVVGDGIITSVNSAPGQPAVSSATVVSGTSSQLSWTAPTYTGGGALTGYRVQVSTGADSGFADAAGGCAPSQTSASTATTCLATGLSPATTYYYRVQAITDLDSGEFSAPYSAASGAAEPGVPTGFTAVTGYPTTTLNWAAPAYIGDAALSGYQLQAKTGTGDWVDLPNGCGSAAQQSSATSCNFTVDDLATSQGTPYSLRIRSLNGHSSTWSSSITYYIPHVPAAPESPANYGISPNLSVDAHWSPPSTTPTGASAITSFTVQVAAGPDYSDWVSAPGCNPGTNYYCSITGLSEGVSYKFRVSANNDRGPSPFSDPSNAFDLVRTGAPGQPTISITNGYPQVTFDYPASSGNSTTDSYRLEYRETGQSTFVSLTSCQTSMPGCVINVDDLNVPQGQGVEVRAAAHNDSGWGPYSAVASFITAHVPASPTNLMMTNDQAGTAELSWTAAQTDPVGASPTTSYTVQIAAGPDFGQWVNGTDCTALTDTSCTISGLDYSTVYKWRVVATNDRGDSAPTLGDQTIHASTAPTAPQAPSVEAHYESAEAHWTAPADNGETIDFYEVQIATDDFTQWTNVTGCVAISATTCMATSLQNGVDYKFRVRAHNVRGLSSYSPASEIVRPSALKPSQPDAPSVSLTDRMATLSWTPPNANGSLITGYIVEYASAPNFVYSVATCVAITPVSCAVSGLAYATTYRFRISAINGIGASQPSDSSADVVVAAAPPSGPGGSGGTGGPGPNPGQTPSLLAQSPLKRCVVVPKGAKLKRGARVLILKSKCTTNAGVAVNVKVAKVGKKIFAVKRTKKGTVVIAKKVGKIKITWSAPATSTHLAYAVTRIYRA